MMTLDCVLQSTMPDRMPINKTWRACRRNQFQDTEALKRLHSFATEVLESMLVVSEISTSSSPPKGNPPSAHVSLDSCPTGQLSCRKLPDPLAEPHPCEGQCSEDLTPEPSEPQDFRSASDER
ncbi:unnamed protein product [Fusarium graminearum]|nr:unnamed protein product [Fusarium graminearum]